MNNKLNSNDSIKLATDKFQLNSIAEMPEIPLYYAPYTKFSIPYSGTLLVSRKDIDFRVTEAVKKKLTIIAAPAGYGKSTIVGSWALRNKDNNKNVIWITLDKEDSEERGFWHNVLYATNHHANIVPFHRIPSFSTEQCMNLIINYFSGISLDNFIIYDDFHNMDCDLIHKSFEYFLAYLPRNLHCILMSRTFPSLPISKMVVNDDVTLFGAKDLKFSHEETAFFLNEIMNLKLSEEDVQSLEIKTEGWIAALKVAALSLRNCSDKSTFVNSFDNNNKMFQYMLEEAINLLETPIKEFLMKTSILKNLNKSICDALTGSDNSGEVLQTLETNNFFITSLDDKKENYRYHHLLSEIMIKLLREGYPDQVNELYLAASRWYEDRGYYQDALEYSLGAKDHQNTLRLLKKYYSTGYPDILGPKSICNYFETIPCGMYGKMPDLCIRYALALAETGQVKTDEEELKKRGIHLDSDVFKGYEGQVSQLRAYIALKYENIVEIIRYSEQALQQLPESDISGATLCLILGYIYRSLGDLKKAEFYFNNALVTGNKVNAVCSGEVSELFILGNFYMTSIRYLKGELDDFITPLNQLLTENITHKNCMYFCLAATYYDYDDFQQAYPFVMKGLELCNTYDDIFYEKVKGFVLLARILFHTGKSAEALHVMNEIDSLVKPDCGNLFILLELPGIVNLLVLLGMPDRAEMYIRKFEAIESGKAKFTFNEAQAELFLAKNDFKQAIDRLEFILTNMDFDVYINKRISLLILTSVTYQANGEDENALACLQKALETKGVERNIRAFVDRGKPMRELLMKFINWTNRNHDRNLLIIAEKLVKRFENKSNALLKGHSIEGFERLSDRELEVLRLLAQGSSYDEIGNALFISLSTVKKHAGNIYDKLKARNRIQAVNIAKANGLVD